MAAYSFETPDRVLQRVQQLEDMELPSLPSFQHDIDYESMSMSETDTSQEELPNYLRRQQDVSFFNLELITANTQAGCSYPSPLEESHHSQS
jgi:hypothetical protein